MAAHDVDELADKIAEKVADRLSHDRDDRAPLSPKQVGERLGVNERTVRGMIIRGTLRSFKVEGSRKVDQAEVDRYLRERRQDD